MASGERPVSHRTDLILELLRRRGERVTRGRRAVLDVLDACTEAREHVTAEEITALATEKAPGLHPATVYRVLTTLGELGLVAHTHVGGSATVYHLTAEVGRHDDVVTSGVAHAHLRCTGCGLVIDIAPALLRPLVNRLARDLDFNLEPAHTALLGTCSACAKLA